MAKVDMLKVILEFTTLVNNDKTRFLEGVLRDYNNHDISNRMLLDYIKQIKKLYTIKYIRLRGGYKDYNSVDMEEFSDENFGDPILRCEKCEPWRFGEILKYVPKDIIIPKEDLRKIVSQLTPGFGEDRVLIIKVVDTPTLKAHIRRFPNSLEKTEFLTSSLKKRWARVKKLEFHALPLEAQKYKYETIYKQIKGDE